MSISIKKDDYVATFDNQGHDEFMEALKEWGKETRFVEVPAKDIYFSPLSSLDPDDVLGGQEVYDDSQRVDALPIVANLPTGEICCVPARMRAGVSISTSAEVS